MLDPDLTLTDETQKCFHGLKPSPPTIRTPRVARAIATRLVKTINDDDFYWEPAEVGERIADVAEEIVRCGRPATVFARLDRQQADANHYGWEGIDEHCRAIADEIAADELAKAVADYRNTYGGAIR